MTTTPLSQPSDSTLSNSVAASYTKSHSYKPEMIFDAKATKEVFLLFNCEDWLQNACLLNDEDMAIAVRNYHTMVILVCPQRIKSYIKSFAERTAHQN